MNDTKLPDFKERLKAFKTMLIKNSRYDAVGEDCALENIPYVKEMVRQAPHRLNNMAEEALALMEKYMRKESYHKDYFESQFQSIVWALWNCWTYSENQKLSESVLYDRHLEDEKRIASKGSELFEK